MIIKFATKRNTNGHRAYIAIDTNSRTYSTNPALWLCREDFNEVTKRELEKIRDEARRDGFKEIDAL